MTTIPDVQDVASEAPSTAERLAVLSHDHAAAGDNRMARLAAWACDVHLLETLLWENGLDEAPDPDAQLAAVGEAVAAAIMDRVPAVTDGLTSRDVVELARDALLATFDESVHALVEERFAPLDHLHHSSEHGSGHGSDHGAEHAEPTALDRLEGRTHEHLVAELRATAADCMVVADLMAAEGSPAGAVRLARQADVAGFEAYLTTAASRAGDDRLVTVDLRWALARSLALPEAPSADQLDPADVGQVVADTRRLLVDLLGSAERTALGGTFEPLTPR